MASALVNRRYYLRRRPQGLCAESDFALVREEIPELKPAPAPAPLPAFLGVLGVTGGITAYVGMDIVKPQPGETVVVSAAGSVGSVAGQIARAKGARVVGIAGGPQKCHHVTTDLGFDACVDYKASDWRAQLDAAAPNGVDKASW